MSRREFGPFVVDLVTGELRRNDVIVPLQPAVAALLVELAARPGSLVSRERLAHRLWPAGINVDYENSLNNTVARLRLMIGKSLIETVSRRGYRLKADSPPASLNAPPDTRATALYAIGRHIWNQTTAESSRRSLTWFDQALEADPGLALAHAAAADSWLMLGDEVAGDTAPRKALHQASASAQRAVAIDPNCAEAIASLGMVAWRLEWDWRKAEELFRAAIALRPDYGTARQYYSWLLQARRNPQESLAQIVLAQRCDPTSAFITTNVGWMLYHARRYNDAIRSLNQALELSPQYPMALLARGLALQQTGDLEGSIQDLERAAALAGPEAAYYRAALGYALAVGNRRKAARRLLDSNRPFDRALLHLGFRQYGLALENLEQAVDEGSSHVSYLMVDPMMQALSAEPRFRRLARAIGLD